MENTQYKDRLLHYFNRMLPLSYAEEGFLKEITTVKRVKKRQLILEEGEVSHSNNFVVEGCFKMFTIDEQGKEHNLQFAIEDWWIGDVGSFYSEEPSQLFIEAMENSVVLQMKKEDQLQLFIEYPKFNHVFRVLTENALVSSQRRILQNISATAEERYLDFIERYPQFLNRISNVQIASFLGVTPEFLSTIRKKLSQS